MPVKTKPGAVVMTSNMGVKHQLPPHPSGSVSHKPPSSLNPNAVIGSGPGMSTTAASGIANGSLQSQINVPSSAHSKSSAAHQHQRTSMQPVPMPTVMLNVNGGSTAQTSDQSGTGATHGSLAL